MKFNNEKVLTSQQYSLDMKKKFYIGVLSEYLLSKEIFPKNIYIKNYIEGIEVLFKKTYKDYLYKSRTLLLASVIRDIGKISDEDEYEFLNAIFNNHIMYDKKNVTGERISKSKSKSNNSTLLEDVLKNRKNRR